MVLRIRLQRFGLPKFPSYRIVTADAKARRDGKFVEKLGTYHPNADGDGNKWVYLDAARVKYWLGVGAHPTDRVEKILALANLVEPKPKLPPRPKAEGEEKKKKK